jgi:hypothetical protein
MSLPLEPTLYPEPNTLCGGYLGQGPGISLKHIQEAREQVAKLYAQKMQQPELDLSLRLDGKSLIQKPRAQGLTEAQVIEATKEMSAVMNQEIQLKEREAVGDVESMKRADLDALYGRPMNAKGPRFTAPTRNEAQQKAAKAKRKAAKKARKNNR